MENRKENGARVLAPRAGGGNEHPIEVKSRDCPDFCGDHAPRGAGPQKWDCPLRPKIVDRAWLRSATAWFPVPPASFRFASGRIWSRRQHYQGRSYWVVKDPIGLQYFRFQEEEFAILQWLDGETSLDEIKDRFEADFPPQKITLEELQQFLGMLHRNGLVIADVGGQGRQLHNRRGEKKRREWFQAASNILCIRFKGFDPERTLNRLYPYVRWFFAPVTAAACIMFALSALTLVCVELDVFRSKMPEFHISSPHNGVLLAVVLCVTKVMHEFGHGLSCKHFGGECHEMGVMILVLTPCLYCNVSDSWMLPNKWHRAFIGAAGMYVELLIASVCTYIWWNTHPGLLNRLCLDVMFVSSVSTVVFNANPLLRYDGYYILADVAEIPNLRQKATTILSHKLGEWCLGLEPTEDPFLPQRNQLFFALYSVAAAAYRWVVAFSICFFLYKLFASYHVQIIGEIVVLASLWGLLVLPLYQVVKFFYVPGRLDQVKKPRFYTSLGVLTAVILLVLFLPLPHSITCTLELQARDALPVYVDPAGQLMVVDVKPGQQVAKGQPLAKLRNLDVELAIAKLQGSIQENREAGKPAAAADSRSARRVGGSRRSEGVGDVRRPIAREDEGYGAVAVVGAGGRHRAAAALHAATRGPRREAAHVVRHAAGT